MKIPGNEGRMRFIWLCYSVKRTDWTNSYGLTGSYDCVTVRKRTGYTRLYVLTSLYDCVMM